ncbi:MAG: glycerol-3-phosphate acyltransferase, partial [Christensenella sp.]
GIAATIGVLLIIQTIPTLIIFAAAIVIVIVTKLMSVGSIIGLILSAVAAFVIVPLNLYHGIAVLLIALLGIWGHRENIVRLIHGNEHKLSLSKK